jgi:GDP-D-mannose 3',5'-epimerase
MKTALVCGGGGFIGGHLVTRLKQEGYFVRVADIKMHDFKPSDADQFYIVDLRDPAQVKNAMMLMEGRTFDEIYQLAADMGGAGYIFTGNNDANVMHNSAQINLNIANEAVKYKVLPKIFYSSSACMYPEYNQLDPQNPKCSEESAYPAAPDSEYGWEKLFSERLYLAYNRNYGLPVRVARFHNIYGPFGSFNNGKEKAPAALCRKVAEQPDGGSIEVWGDGNQTRSFLYVDDCVEGIRRLMDSDFLGPVNIGSEEMVSINELAQRIIDISEKKLSINNCPGPQGVRGRNSDNTLIQEKLGWKPNSPLNEGLAKTYSWINDVVQFLTNMKKEA